MAAEEWLGDGFLAVCQEFAVPTTVRLIAASEGEDTHVANVRNPERLGQRG
jgi:hypothetical protein